MKTFYNQTVGTILPFCECDKNVTPRTNVMVLRCEKRLNKPVLKWKSLQIRLKTALNSTHWKVVSNLKGIYDPDTCSAVKIAGGVFMCVFTSASMAPLIATCTEGRGTIPPRVHG